MIPESNPTISILNALNRHIMAVYELTLNQFSGCQDIWYPQPGSNISLSDISDNDIEHLSYQVEIRSSQKIACYGKGFIVQPVLFWNETLSKNSECFNVSRLY